MEEIGKVLSPWAEGLLDLHHINTGRGDAAFYVFPDGTTMLLDAGELDPTRPRTNSPRNAQARPNGSRPPYEWIARYIRQMSPDPKLDYGLITHFHDDHFGALHKLAPLAPNGAYRLTGLAGVGDLVPIRTLIDRGFPNYDYPMSLDGKEVQSLVQQNPHLGPALDNISAALHNYHQFTVWQRKNNGMTLEQIEVGLNDQIVPTRRPDGYDLEVRNIAANGRVWTGRGTDAKSHFPSRSDLGAHISRLENLCSIALRIRYGQFDYFNGGDITGLVELDDPPWFDLETPIARAVGPTNVQVLNHHGYRNTHHEFFIRTTRPRVLIQQNWCADQPGQGVLKRLTSTSLYPGPRDLFALELLEANRIFNGGLADQAYQSQRGHIVVRVEPGGGRYWVIILDDTNESYRVTAVHGPYESWTCC